MGSMPIMDKMTSREASEIINQVFDTSAFEINKLKIN
jgi:hypothetical protein